jgi:hypothetical protein
MSVDKRMLARSSPAGLAWWHAGGRYSDDPDQWNWLAARHLLLLSEKLVDVAAGRCPRLIVTMPPRHGKSELISKYTPAWFLGNFPDRKVMLASYADTFAAQWGRKARDVLKAEHDLFGLQINPETSGGQYWELIDHDGVMVTAGVGGGLTGKGAHLLIIDDPIKNAEEAHSDKTRENHWDWWKSTARTRLQKGAGVILVMTRWHEDDLAGRMLADDPTRDKYGVKLPDGQRRDDVEGDEWELLNLPAFAEPEEGDGSISDAEGVLRDLIGRAKGDVLWPEMFDSDWMGQTKRAQGAYWFSAMYQQRPSPAEGLLFKRENFRYYERHTSATPDTGELVSLQHDTGPALFDVVYGTKFQTVDVAASEDEQADYTVISTWLVTPERHLLWWDCDWQQFDSTKTPGFVRRAYYKHSPGFIGVERLGHGLNIIQTLIGEGLPIIRLEADRDKVSRALPVCARYEAHTVFHPVSALFPSGALVQDAEKQLLDFPNSKNDDIVDTVSYAGIKLPQLGAGGAPRTESQANKRGGNDRETAMDRTGHRARRGTITGGLLSGDF